MALKWNGDQVLGQVLSARNAILDETAFAIEDQTKRNIVGNEQVDTGFMLNSVGTVTSQGSTFDQAKSAATARNPNGNMGAEPRVSKGNAAVFVGAEYAIYQEIERSFLFNAGQQVIGSQVNGIIKRNQVK